MAHTIIMTGATRGIGRAAIEHHASRDPDAHLVVLARGRAGDEVVADLRAAGHTATSIGVDLLSLEQVRSAADVIRARIGSGELPPLRGLIANAGLQFSNDVTTSQDGFEATFAVNVLAVHLLIRLLDDLFETGSRVVVTVSDVHFGDLRHNLGMVPAPVWREPDVLARVRAFDDPESMTAGRTAYSTSKLAAIHLVHELARRLPNGVSIAGYNPGFVPATGLTRDADAGARFVMRRVAPLLGWLPFIGSVPSAGRQLADVALGKVPFTSGAYIDRTAEAPSSKESYDDTRERDLWIALERMTGPFLR